MKKMYSKPEVKAYAVMPCMTLAASPFTGTTEGMGSNGDFDWNSTSPTSSDDSETNSDTYKRTHPVAY